MTTGISVDFEEFAAAHLALEKALNEPCAVSAARHGKASDSKAMDAFLERFDEMRHFIRDYARLLEADLDAISEAVTQVQTADFLAARNFQVQRESVLKAREHAPDRLFDSVDDALTGEEKIAEQKANETNKAFKDVRFGL